MLENRKMKKCQKQILSLLDDIYKSGLPCEVDLYYLNENRQPSGRNPVHIPLDDIPIEILKEKDNYVLSVILYDLHALLLDSYNSKRNELTRNYIKDLMDNEYYEEIINYQRGEKLKDILND
jgi:hypothetical protein